MEIRKKRLFQLSIFFFLSSMGVTAFLFYELGMFDSIPAIADTKPQVSSIANSTDRKERELADKEALLNTQAGRYEKSIKEFKEKYEKNIQELKSKNAELESQIEKKNAALKKQTEIKQEEANKQAKIELFRQLYEKMESKKAAQVFDQLDVALAVQILSTMKPKIAAEIMDKMNPDRTRTVTEKFLGKRVLAKNPDEISGQ